MTSRTSADERGYLTVNEVADELGISASGVYKLIDRGQLGAIRRSARRIVVPVRAFAAYRRGLGRASAPASFQVVTADPEDLAADFLDEKGCSPRDWVGRWKAGGIEDSPETMRDLIRAVALLSAMSGQGGDPGVDAALATAATFAQLV